MAAPSPGRRGSSPIKPPGIVPAPRGIAGGAGGYTYSWSPTTGLNDATAAKPVFSASSEGDHVFSLTVTDGRGTTATDSVAVTVAEPCASRLDTVERTITVGNFPRYLAVSPDSSRIYAANFSDDTMSVVRTSDHTVVSMFAVGNEPNMLAISPDGAYLDAPLNNRKVAVVRTSDNTVVKNIAVGDRPWGVAVSPDGSRVYICNHFADTLSVIRTSDHTVIDTVSVGSGPQEVVVSPDNDYVYVTSLYADTVSVISTADHKILPRHCK